MGVAGVMRQDAMATGVLLHFGRGGPRLQHQLAISHIPEKASSLLGELQKGSDYLVGQLKDTPSDG